MFSIIHYLFLLPIRIVSRLRRWLRSWFLFIQPNILKILIANLKYNGLPIINQLTLCKGKGKVEIGKDCSFGYKLGGGWRGGSIELQARFLNSKIKIGNNVYTNNNIFICSANSIEIGDDTLIGQGVTIMDFEGHGISASERRKIGKIGSVVIGENCWIGNNVIILKNSSIGANTIVAAGAVVSGIFPNDVIIGGIPAKIIRHL